MSSGVASSASGWPAGGDGGARHGARLRRRRRFAGEDRRLGLGSEPVAKDAPDVQKQRLEIALDARCCRCPPPAGIRERRRSAAMARCRACGVGRLAVERQDRLGQPLHGALHVLGQFAHPVAETQDRGDEGRHRILVAERGKRRLGQDAEPRAAQVRRRPGGWVRAAGSSRGRCGAGAATVPVRWAAGRRGAAGGGRWLAVWRAARPAPGRGASCRPSGPAWTTSGSAVPGVAGAGR